MAHQLLAMRQLHACAAPQLQPAASCDHSVLRCTSLSHRIVQYCWCLLLYVVYAAAFLAFGTATKLALFTANDYGEPNAGCVPQPIHVAQ